ncbi:MAG TPA: GyrI-like domain-containing protein [Candidatus Thermoplasmatota archaeon]|nr:GyrI-like domain-containing protein [Candidatus Thermoplasmatota archaeon]
MEPRIEALRERWVCVVPHRGPAATVDETRRPLYRHMVQHELVGGPSILRFLDPPRDGRTVDALVVTHTGFEGDAVCRVERLPAGDYAVLDYEGPEEGLAAARQRLLEWARSRGGAAGPLLQVHLMDPLDGVVEQQLQVPLGRHDPNH